jgi:tetratricopeptide (TPR) repeat protein
MKSSDLKIFEKYVEMPTYDFYDPNPIANFGRMYPYFKFDRYTNYPKNKKWKMIVMENQYIKLYVCPEIGGKVWGAIEKSTEKEFMYFNDVVKFRDVSVRGAWTSGGLEYNFGDIGHAPSCATPVNYELIRKTNYVSCVVGAFDLVSRTYWSVEIKLGDKKAFFETNVHWENNRNIPCTYYHWMNAAAKSSNDLKFLYPGNVCIGHGGEVSSWPMQDGKDVSYYRNNNFGSYKSYHIVNSYSNFFGGVYEDENFGFGHLSDYCEKPGKKIWIWGLSDEGKIWEDYLTDANGQYIEYQSGKLFNQAANSSTKTPFKHREFDAYDNDQLRELWFPIKDLKNVRYANELALFDWKQVKDSVVLTMLPLQEFSDDLIVPKANGVSSISISAIPLQKITLVLPKLDINSNLTLKKHNCCFKLKDYQNLQRPISGNKQFDWNSSYGYYIQGLEYEKQRDYISAKEMYKKSLHKNSSYIPAISKLALILYKNLSYHECLELCKNVLEIDTYSGHANYIYGLACAKLGKIEEAKSAFSISSHSICNRLSSFIELAKLASQEHNYNLSIKYAKKALQYNSNSATANKILVVSYRKLKEFDKYSNSLLKLRGIEQISDFFNFERVLSKKDDFKKFNDNITCEFKSETVLELAIFYDNLGDRKTAINLLKNSHQSTLNLLWLGYLIQDINIVKKALDMPVQLIFPHREETLKVLEELSNVTPHWKLKYYSALIYYKIGKKKIASDLINTCKLASNDISFNLNSYTITHNVKYLKQAFVLDSLNWRVALEYMNNVNCPFQSKIELLDKLLKMYPENSLLGLKYAEILFSSGHLLKALEFLKSFYLLPSEGAINGRKLYRTVCIYLAIDEYKKSNYRKSSYYADLAKKWPSNLGSGKPYKTDDRIENYIIFMSNSKLKGELRSDYLQNYFNNSEENTSLIFQFLFLLKKGKKEEYNKLYIKNLVGEEINDYLLWVKNVLDNNDTNSIEKKIESDEKEIWAYDTKLVDPYFNLVKYVIKVLIKREKKHLR